MSPPATTASLNECIVGSRCLITTRRHASRESFSRPPVEPTRVIPQQLLLRLRLQARPTEGMVDRVREAAFGVWIIGRIHQDIVPKKLVTQLNMSSPSCISMLPKNRPLVR